MIKFKTYKSELALALNTIFNMNNTCFSFGTIEGVYEEKPDVFEILMVINNQPHNGDFRKFIAFISIDYLQAEIVSLRSLLRDCKPYVQKEMENIIKGYGTGNCDWIWKTSYLLTRINEIIEE